MLHIYDLCTVGVKQIHVALHPLGTRTRVVKAIQVHLNVFRLLFMKLVGLGYIVPELRNNLHDPIISAGQFHEMLS